MWMEFTLATLWSVNGPLEKQLLKGRQADGYATTKALIVAGTYLVSRRPIDVSILRSPLAWVLFAVSVCNTPLYARIVQSRNASLVLPFVSTLANMLRLLWSRLIANEAPLTPRQWIAIALVLIAGRLLQPQ